MSRDSSSYRIKGFDGLRAIAVTLVFFHHNTAVGSALNLGRSGVWLFFVLSGFLIIGILHAARARIEEGGGFGSEIGRFFWRRSLRIFPIYYITLALTVPLALAAHKVDISVTGALMMATYMANVWIAQINSWPPGFSHLWSLSIEEQFYLFAAALFLFVPARRHLLLCLALVAMAIAAQLTMVALHAPDIAIYTNSLVNFGIIALGGATSLLAGSAGKGRSSIAGIVFLALFLAVPVLGVMSARFATNLTLIAIALLLVSLFRAQTSALVAALELPPLRWLGRVSYGFYLFHNFLTVHQIAGVARHFGLGLPQADGTLILLPVSFALSIAAATASWWLIERPIQNLGRPRTGRVEEPLLV